MTYKLIKNNLIVTIFVLLGMHFGIPTAALAGPSDDFVTTWQTVNDNETLYIPVAPSYYLNGGSYNYDVDWDNDGTFDELGLTGAASHVFATAGNHTIRIQGSYPGIRYAYNQNFIAVEQWGTGGWESMYEAFTNVSNLDINATDTANMSAVTNMSRMFYGVTSFNQDISSWNVSNVTNMTQMFFGATSFNQDISSWDVSNIAGIGLHQIFRGATSFNQDISSWDVSNVTNMSFMFYGAISFNQDISSWDVSNVTDMSYMFDGATSFNQNIGSWDISNTANLYRMLAGVTLSTTNYDALLIGWGGQTLQSNVQFNAGNNQYCAEAAQVAKANMGNISNWTIIDGGAFADASCKSETLVFNDATLNVDENSAIGTVVGTVHATAPLGNVLTYKILPSLRSGWFAINPSTGEITTRVVMNYESINSFSLNIQVDNGDGGVATLANTASMTIDVNDLDDTAPVLSITGLADGAQTNQMLETFSGSIDETVTLTINGVAVTVENDLTFSHDITLTEGFNTVTIIATDLAGNITTNTRSIRLFTGIELVNETISEDTIWGLTNSNYLIRGIITVESGVTLTIEPGTIIKGSGGQLLIDGGSLLAEGTASDKIIFTSFKDLSLAVGDWRGIVLQQDATGDFKHVSIQYASTAVSTADTASILISDSEIYNNSTGIRASDNSIVNVENTELYINYYGVYADKNSRVDVKAGRVFANSQGLSYGRSTYDSQLGQYVPGNTGGRVEGVEIFANNEGLYSQSTKTIDVRGNWWGAVDGPSGVGGGSGDVVYGNVLIWDVDQRILTQGSGFNLFDGERSVGYSDHRKTLSSYGIESSSFSTSLIDVRPYYDNDMSYYNSYDVDLTQSMNVNLDYKYMGGSDTAVLPVNNKTLNYTSLNADSAYTLMITPLIPDVILYDDPCNYYPSYSSGCYPDEYAPDGYKDGEMGMDYYYPEEDPNNYISEQRAFSPLTITSTVGFNSGPSSITGSLSQTTYAYQFNATEEIDLTVYVENWDDGGYYDVQLEKAALEKVFLVENKTDDLSPATFDAIQFNDKDGDGLVSIGDEYHFQFSKPVDSQLIVNGTADADQVLHPAGDASYGNSNAVYWGGDQKSVVIRITEGFSITGDEIITLTGLVDKNSNAVMGNQQLTLLDTIAPQLIGFDWEDLDSNQEISIGDNYIFHFDEAMDASVITDGTTTANSKMPPSVNAYYHYGDVNTVSWSANGKDLTITLASGFTITGSERVYPHSDVVDSSGNSVLGTVQLIGRDTTAPLFTQVAFNDNDANDVISLGDSYTFSFNEPMYTGNLLNSTTAANTRLSPEGKLYGNINTIEWNTQGTEVTITVTDGFTITGGELVTPSSAEPLYDLRFNRLSSNTVTLPAITVAAIDVIFDSQLDGITTTQPIQTISGQLTGSGTLTINGTEVTVETDLSFSHDVILTEGENTITVIAIDLSSNTKSTVLTIILHTPMVTGVPLYLSAVDINGTTAYEDKVTPEFLGTNVNNSVVQNLRQRYVWNQVENLVLPQFNINNTFYISVSSMCWSSDDAYMTLAFYNDADEYIGQLRYLEIPNVSYRGQVQYETASGEVTTFTSFHGLYSGHISGDLSFENNQIKFQQDSNPYGISSFILDVDLSDTAYVKVSSGVYATYSGGTCGAVAWLRRTQPAENVEPIITITSPIANSRTAQALQTITGSLNKEAELVINGEVVTVESDLSFSHSTILSEGENSITLVVTDAESRSATSILNVTLDTIEPVITVASPIANSTVQQSTITLVGQLNEAGTLAVNGQAVAIETNLSFSHPVTLVNGSNTIILNATDIAGNNSTQNLTITLGTSGLSENDFVTTWQTTSPNETITIPTKGGGYNYEIDWNNDGYFEQTGVAGDASYSYATAGNHTIRIRGSFPRIYTYRNGFASKIRSVEQWGSGAWISMENAFREAGLLVINATDSPNLSQVNSLAHMFTNAYNAEINPYLSTWDVSNVTNMEGLFYAVWQFNYNLGAWNVSRVTNMRNMFGASNPYNGIDFSTANYEALLIGWANQTLQQGVELSRVPATYCSVEAQVARAKIISLYNWTIRDNGLESSACNTIMMENQSFNLDENAVDGSSVGTVQATQIDSQVLTYSITTGNINNAFAINSTTGEITVNVGSELDYETRNAYSLTVQAIGGIPALTKTATITININDVDDSKPIITVTAPLPNSKTGQASQTITGSLNELATLTINGEAVTVETDLSFSHNITLVEGSNTITFVATDTAGNTATDTLTTALDTVGPVISITSPANNSTLLQSITTITGQLDEAGTLTINGQAVTVDADFSFSYPVTLLAGSNTFTLTATDTVSNVATATLTVILDDQTAPTITLLNLIDGAVSNQAEQVISGSLNEPGTLTVNGTLVTVESDLTYSHTLTLTEGENTITIIATDVAGNSATETRTITLDTTLPIVTITAPADGLLTNDLNQTIAGSISENVTLTVNGEPATVATDLTFSHAIELSEGENTVTVTATDVAGNITTQTITITLDLSAPAITVTSPADGLLTTQAAQIIMGNLAAIGTLTINDFDVTVETDLSFSHAITLTEGENSITLIATDELSNTITQSLNLELDTTAPIITVSSPEDGGFLAQNITAITGSLNEVAALTINGESVTIDAELTFTHDLSLNEGENTFTLVATDDAGHSTSQSLTVTLDDAVAPTITITSPQDGLVTSQAVHNIIGSINEAGSITINGSDITVNNDLSFSHEITLVDGENVVTVVASDAATNTSTVLLNITLDNALPTTPVVTSHAISPTENLLAQKLVTITGTREANTSIWIDGTEQVALGSDDWTATLTLNEGNSLVSIIAKDAAQNSSAEATVQFKIDTTVPVISNVTPAAILNTIPNVIQVNFTEAGSGLDNANTQLVVVRNAVIVEGSLAINVDNLVFTPTQALQEGVYTIRPQLVDIAGNNAAVNDYTFTLDFTPPSTPVLSAYSATTNINVVSFNGTKDAGTAIALNGVEIVAENGNTTWSHQASLVAGSNVIDFTAIDSAGNESAAATATVTFDDTAPGAISLVASANGNGTEIVLDWADYDEFANGNDIAEYRVYSATSDFTDVASANLIATVAAGTKTATASNLTRQQSYFFAVVAVDVQGNVLSNVTAVAATPADTTAPSNVADFNANSFADNLQLSWTSLSATVNDVAGYKLYIDGAVTGIDLGSAITTYDLNGLTAATGYTLRLTAVDNDGNENEGVTLNAATLLSNPAITSTESLDGLVSLTWDHSQPHALVADYNIYAETSDFGNSVAGLTPKTTATKDDGQASVLSLNNQTQYWFAVAAVNISGGETKTVTTAMAMPTPDSQGPEITSILLDGQTLIADQLITTSAQIAVTATDRTGISRIELLVDGTLISSESTASNGSYTLPWDILATTDGAHSLTIRAVDTLGNESDQIISVNVALAPPSAPTLSQPVADTNTNQQQLTVAGQADLHTQVKIYNNGSVVGTPITVNEQGLFSLNINLVEGANAITATAEYPNRGGDSASSANRTITLDQSVPNSPSGFAATSRILGEVRLTWNSVADPRVQGYNIYRSSAPFESSSESGVEKLNTLFITDEGYTDLPIANGLYYYRVTSANDLGSESIPSQQVSAESDSLGPRALSIVYTPDGNTDSDTGRIAPGLVDVEITFDEALRNTPSFALTPNGGVPILIKVTKDRNDERIYRGNFVLQNTTPSGLAFAVLAAHDEYGNRGTEIDSGASLLIDTNGPDVVELTLNPTHPIQVDPQLAVSARTIDISVRLNEAVADGFQPRLIPKLDNVVIQGYSDGISLSRDTGSLETAPVWTGQLVLPASAGQNADASDGVQVLSFSHSAFDDLDNESTKIHGLNQFQVYQGDLPPVGIPFGLTAKAVAGGNIELNWQSVEQASGYKLYRQAFNETQMTELTVLAGADTLTYTEVGLADGLYQYAIASTRAANAQLSESGLSEAVTVIADGTKPNAPQNLQLELNGAGTVLRWIAPTGELDLSKITYNLYRLPIVEGEPVDLQGVTPLQSNIPHLADPIALDKQPDRNARTYVLTAVDAAGNESIGSNAVTQAIVLLPVSNLAINLQEEGYPHLTWTHTDNTVQGYDVYIDSISEDNKLNTIGMVTDTFFTDTSYNNGSPSNGAELQRHYIVVAIDDQATRSIGHSLVLPALNVALNNAGSQQLDRGIMNKLIFRVDNKGDAASQNQRLFVTIDDDGTSRQHQSNSFSVDASSFTLVPVVVGGYNSLDNLGELQLQLQQTPQAGEHVTIAQSDSIVVGDNALSISLTTEEFTRGATGKVRFTLENNSSVETELLLAKSNGNQASPEIRLIIEDLEGNTLSTQAIKQFGGGAITTTNGNTVARIAAGDSFTSELIEIAIPGASPDQIQLRLEIDRYHYHLDRSDHVRIKGSDARKTVDLIDTAYYAEITSISDSIIYGNQPIVIQGRGIDRVTAVALANIPVKLVFSVSGFERSNIVYTDNAGNFEYSYIPSNNESGRYKLSAIHPDVTDRPNQGEFVIQIVQLNPEQYDLRVPKNFNAPIQIRVTTGKETPLNNLRIAYLAKDQVNSLLPEGININTGATLNVAANKTAYLTPIFRADPTANDSGQIRLRVISDDNLADPLGFITVNYILSAATPSLHIGSLGYIETGVGLDKSITEKLTLSNKGLAGLHNIQLSLTEVDGSTPAPSWLYLSSGATLDDMNADDSAAVNITFNPSNTVAEADYEFRLKITSDELADIFVRVYVAVTQSGKGSAFFHASDIYTATLDEYGSPIPGLAGARIKLQNEQVLTEEHEANADANGEVLFSDIPAGRYIFRASAPDHQDVSGRLVIKPGITVVEEVFLMNQIITVEFSVNEITIQDRYEIILKATYETSVPVAVVIADPLSINLPVMKKGETLLGEIRLTNYGFIRAGNLVEQLPASNSLIKFELLQQAPEALEAGEIIILPYRITALNDFNPETDGEATGGGCGSLNANMCHNYSSQCANGATVPGRACTAMYASWGTCSGGGGSGGGGFSFSGLGGFGGIGVRGAPQSISKSMPECLAVGGTDCGGDNGSAE